METRNNILKKENYGDWKVFHPSGKLMFLCSEKKAKWYLDRDLAVITEDKQVMLKFEPAGLGEDEDGLIGRANICVGCGSEDSLTRHHIIPREFRKFFPEELKARNSYDVMLLCRECHDEYEVHSKKLKDSFGLDISGYFYRVSMLKLYARYLEKIDDNYMLEFILDRLTTLFPRVTLSREDLDIRIKENIHPIETYVKSLDSLQTFVEMWRKHFIEYMSPDFLPAGWRVDKGIYKSKN